MQKKWRSNEGTAYTVEKEDSAMWNCYSFKFSIRQATDKYAEESHPAVSAIVVRVEADC